MATLTKARKSVKPARRIRLCLPPFEGNPGVVQISVGKKSADYYCWPRPSDFGAAFELEKFGTQGGERYHVLLSEDGQHSCECKGFLRWGRCKHTDGLAALTRAGKL